MYQADRQTSEILLTERVFGRLVPAMNSNDSAFEIVIGSDQKKPIRRRASTNSIGENETSDSSMIEHEKRGLELQILDQYKLYVGMADQISGRRSISNSFFLTANTVVLSTLGLVGRLYLQQSVLGLVGVLVVLGGAVMFCVAWRAILMSYDRLNAVKFQIIIEIEDKLPLQPYKTEWARLGYGKKSQVYRPLSHLERWVPLGFIFMYIILASAWVAALV